MAFDEAIARARALIAATLFVAGFVSGNFPARAEEPTAKEYWTEEGDLVVPFGSVTFQVPAKYAHAPGFGYMPGSMKFYFNWPSFTPLPAPTKGGGVNQRVMVIVSLSERARQVDAMEFARRTGVIFDYTIPDGYTGIVSGDEYSIVNNGRKFSTSEKSFISLNDGNPVGRVHCNSSKFGGMSCIGYFDYACDSSFSIGFSIHEVADIPPIEEAVRRFLNSMRKQEG